LRSRPSAQLPRPVVAGAIEGLVVSHLGIAVDVEWPDGQRIRERVTRNTGIVVGDRVSRDDHRRLVRHPRTSELKRRSFGGGVHVVGANLSCLVVVAAADPPARVGLLDRACVAARAAGLAPAIAFNKADLDDDQVMFRELVDGHDAQTPFFCVSAKTGVGLASLSSWLGTHGRGALIGSSGVGKSSLLNALVPGASLATRELSAANGTGRHTTTVSTLLRLDNGAELVDTPGVREFGLVDITPHELALYFPTFAHRPSECRYRDCLHADEPGCAVVDAVERDELGADRYAAYLTLLDEVRHGNAAANAGRRRNDG
jgi:ribosome biogenesis GTPase / thiamine phosphate phosphatase